MIVAFNSPMKNIFPITVDKFGNDGNFLICFHFSRNFGGIHHKFCMEDFLLDSFIKIITYCIYKHPLSKIGYFAGWYQTIHLRTDRD